MKPFPDRSFFFIRTYYYYMLFPDRLESSDSAICWKHVCNPFSELSKCTQKFFSVGVFLHHLIEYELNSQKNKSLRELDPEGEYK
jgi:hypothetical protein